MREAVLLYPHTNRGVVLPHLIFVTARHQNSREVVITHEAQHTKRYATIGVGVILVAMQTFRDKVRFIVSKIKRGETRTYGEVALRAGNKGAARAVGAIMRANRSPDVPCHRVVRSDGTLGGYSRGGTKVKARMLQEEQR